MSPSNNITFSFVIADKLKKKVDDSPFLAGQLPNSILLKGWRPIKPDDRKENGYQRDQLTKLGTVNKYLKFFMFFL